MLRRYSKAAARGISTRSLSHNELEAQILEYLNYMSETFAWSTHGTRNRPELEGVADIIMCRSGHLVAIEIKVGRDKQRTTQQLFEQDIELAGGDYRVVRSIEDLNELLEGE